MVFGMGATDTQQQGTEPAGGLAFRTGFLLALLGQYAMHRFRRALSSHELKPRQLQILELLSRRARLASAS